MVSISQVFATITWLSALASGAAIDPRQTGCASGVYIISLHGCGEQGANEGAAAAYSNGIKNGVQQSQKLILNYNGNCTAAGYLASRTEGIARLKNQISSYADKCTNGKIVLVGYSEGANIVMSTLGGSEDDGTNPMNANYVKNIVLMGDPSRTVGTPGNKGTNQNSNGIFRRSQQSIDRLNNYNGRIISFCDLGDVFCAPNTQGSGSNVHGSYFAAGHYVNEGVSFAVNLAKA